MCHHLVNKVKRLSIDAHFHLPILGGLKHNPIQIINHSLDRVRKRGRNQIINISIQFIIEK